MKPGDKVDRDCTGDEVGMGTCFNQVATEALSEKVTSKQSFTNKEEAATEIWGQSIPVGARENAQALTQKPLGAYEGQEEDKATGRKRHEWWEMMSDLSAQARTSSALSFMRESSEFIL